MTFDKWVRAFGLSRAYWKRPRKPGKLRQWEVAQMKRPEAAPSGARTPHTGGLFDGCPNVLALLSDAKYDDGGDRQLATLTLFADGQQWKVCLSDRDTARVVFKTGGTAEDAVAALEIDLEAGVADWRRVTGGRKKT